MATLPQFKARQLARRSTSDLDRLATQFRKGVGALTGEYEASFAQYQKQRAEQMAPFEQEMERYKTIAMPAYEAASAEYKKALDAYQAQLADIEANPTVATKVFKFNPRGGEYRATEYEPREIPKFTAQRPEIPAVPQAPKLAKFDDTQFEKRKAVLQEEYSREVGERRAGRMSAASRKSARPLLQGT